MREIQFKKFYEKLEKVNESFQNLIKVHYSLISMLVPEKKPTKREIEIFEQRKKEKVIPLEKIEKRLKNV